MPNSPEIKNLTGTIDSSTQRAAIVLAKIEDNLKDNKEVSIIFESQSQSQRMPASLAKIMSVIVVWDKVKADSIDYKTHAVNVPTGLLQGSSKVYQFFKDKESLPLIELVKASLIASSNEAAYALAEWHSGSQEAFIRNLNEKAQQLGMLSTQWTSASGLDRKAYTTAKDMLLMATVFIKDYPEVMKFCAQKDYGYNGKSIKNTNKLLAKFENVKGLKTGNLAGVGANLINYYCLDNAQYISVVLEAESRALCFEISEHLMQLE